MQIDYLKVIAQSQSHSYMNSMHIRTYIQIHYPNRFCTNTINLNKIPPNMNKNISLSTFVGTVKKSNSSGNKTFLVPCRPCRRSSESTTSSDLLAFGTFVVQGLCQLPKFSCVFLHVKACCFFLQLLLLFSSLVCVNFAFLS